MSRRGSDHNLSLALPIPIGDALSPHFNQNDIRRIDAFVEPPIQIAGPMSPKSRLVSDQFGDAFDGDVDGIGKNPTLPGKSKRNLRIRLYVGDRPSSNVK